MNGNYRHAPVGHSYNCGTQATLSIGNCTCKPVGVAPCGSTYGTAAGPHDGKTRCSCGEVHPIDPRGVRIRLPNGDLTPFGESLTTGRTA